MRKAIAIVSILLLAGCNDQWVGQMLQGAAAGARVQQQQNYYHQQEMNRFWDGMEQRQMQRDQTNALQGISQSLKKITNEQQ